MTIDAIALIPLKDLQPDPMNARAGAEADAELIASVKERGVVEPIIVRQAPGNGHFLIVAGQRRADAAKQAGQKAVPAIVRTYTDEEAATISLVENVQREDLTPLEEARSYKRLLELTKGTQDSVAKLVGKARPTIANALRLLDAPAPIQKALEQGLSGAAARVALSVPERSLDLLKLKPDVSVEQLTERAKVVNRLDAPIAALRARIAKAQEEGKTVTWPTSGYEARAYVAGQDINLYELLGQPKAKLAGTLSRGYGVTPAIHDAACKCDTVAVDRELKLERACSSPGGWKKAQARERTSRASASPQKKKRVQTAKAKEARLRAVQRQSEKEAAAAFAGKRLSTWHGMNLVPTAAQSRGGLAGEPARLALFGLLAKYSQARGPLWKVELWKKIAAAPLPAVRDRVTQYVLGIALREIADASRYKDKYGNTKKLRTLVALHYAGRKKAKGKK